MSIIEAAFIAGPAAIAGTAAYVAQRLSCPSGRHRKASPHAHAAPRDPFADPAGRDDPHGEKYAADLRDTAAQAWKPDPRPLARLVRDLDGNGGTCLLPALRDDPPPGDTGVIPADVSYLGMPTEEYVEQLFAKYEQAQS